MKLKYKSIDIMSIALILMYTIGVINMTFFHNSKFGIYTVLLIWALIILIVLVDIIMSTYSFIVDKISNK